MAGKSRDIPLDEYLRCLSREWMGAMVRSRVLPLAKDRRYWERVMGYKEGRIRDISGRNGLLNLFTDTGIYAEFLNERNSGGFPAYLFDSDLPHYYGVGKRVMRWENGTWAYGSIVRFDGSQGLVKMDGRGEEVMGVGEFRVMV